MFNKRHISKSVFSQVESRPLRSLQIGVLSLSLSLRHYHSLTPTLYLPPSLSPSHTHTCTRPVSTVWQGGATFFPSNFFTPTLSLSRSRSRSLSLSHAPDSHLQPPAAPAHPHFTRPYTPTSYCAEMGLFLELGRWFKDVRSTLCHGFSWRKQAVSLFAPKPPLHFLL